jgi:hypothetical protein
MHHRQIRIHGPRREFASADRVRGRSLNIEAKLRLQSRQVARRRAPELAQASRKAGSMGEHAVCDLPRESAIGPAHAARKTSVMIIPNTSVLVYNPVKLKCGVRAVLDKCKPAYDKQAQRAHHYGLQAWLACLHRPNKSSRQARATNLVLARCPGGGRPGRLQPAPRPHGHHGQTGLS